MPASEKALLNTKPECEARAAEDTARAQAQAEAAQAEQQRQAEIEQQEQIDAEDRELLYLQALQAEQAAAPVYIRPCPGGVPAPGGGCEPWFTPHYNKGGFSTICQPDGVGGFRCY